MKGIENRKEYKEKNVSSIRKIFKPWMFWLLILLILLSLFIGLSGTNNWDFGHAANIAFKQVLVDNFLGITPVLLGIIAFSGYLILKRGFIQSLLGFIKTVIGVIIMTTGSGIIVGMAKPIFKGFSLLMGTNVVSLDPYLGWTSAQSFLGQTSLSFGGFAISAISFSMIFGLLINVILVLLKKVTNLRSVMVTGHIMFQQSAIFTAMIFMFIVFSLKSVNLSDASTFYPIMIGTILISGISLGLYWATTTSAVSKATDKITGNAGFTLGHQQMIGAFVASKLGKYFGKSDDSAENRKLSKKFKIFEDNIFTQLIIVFIMFFILIMVIQFSPIPAGQKESEIRFAYNSGGKISYLDKSWIVADNAHWSINMILGPFKFIGALLVLTTGVRMFVTELQQSFQGIIDKVLKDGMVAVDVAATYGFSPNSITYGFVSGTIAQFLAMGLTLGLSFIPNSGISIIIPLFITLFFNSGAMGIYANSTGGWKAAIIVPAIMGFAEIIIAMFGVMIINNSYESVKHLFASGVTSPIETGYIGMFDWNFGYSIIFMFMGIPYVGVWIGIAVLWAIFIIWAQLIVYSDETSGILYKKIFKKTIKNKDAALNSTKE